MDPQQLLKTSKFYSRCKNCDIEKTLGGGWVPPPFGSPKAKRTADACICIAWAITEVKELDMAWLLNITNQKLSERLSVIRGNGEGAFDTKLRRRLAN